jgi:hypothetical protein
LRQIIAEVRGIYENFNSFDVRKKSEPPDLYAKVALTVTDKDVQPDDVNLGGLYLVELSLPLAMLRGPETKIRDKFKLTISPL